MPSVENLMRVLGPLVSDANEAERRVRMAFSGSRIYVPPIGSQKRPGLVREIERLSRTLPTGVVAARLECSHTYVRRVVAQRKTPKSAKNPGDTP